MVCPATVLDFGLHYSIHLLDEEFPFVFETVFGARFPAIQCHRVRGGGSATDMVAIITRVCFGELGGETTGAVVPHASIIPFALPTSVVRG